jgi:hypothetical protein
MLQIVCHANVNCTPETGHPDRLGRESKNKLWVSGFDRTLVGQAESNATLPLPALSNLTLEDVLAAPSSVTKNSTLSQARRGYPSHLEGRRASRAASHAAALGAVQPAARAPSAAPQTPQERRRAAPVPPLSTRRSEAHRRHTSRPPPPPPAPRRRHPSRRMQARPGGDPPHPRLPPGGPGGGSPPRPHGLRPAPDGRGTRRHMGLATARAPRPESRLHSSGPGGARRGGLAE